MIFFDGTGNISANSNDSILNLGTSGLWTSAEFNIFGDGGAGEYNFNAGATLVVQIAFFNGTSASPLCLNKSFTGETNNLSLTTENSCCPFGGTSSAVPGLTFTETTNPSGVIPQYCPLYEASGRYSSRCGNGAAGGTVVPPKGRRIERFLVSARQRLAGLSSRDLALGPHLGDRLEVSLRSGCRGNTRRVYEDQRGHARDREL